MNKIADVFKLYFKSGGGQPTLPASAEYNYPVGEIEASNFEELGNKATQVINKLGIGLGEFGVDLFNVGKDYNNANGTGKRQDQELFTNHTGEY